MKFSDFSSAKAQKRSQAHQGDRKVKKAEISIEKLKRKYIIYRNIMKYYRERERFLSDVF